MDNNSFYTPSNTKKDTNRTYVPDMYRQVVAEMQDEAIGQESGISSAQVVHLQSRPLVGVLYSISAGIEGELFPIYVGRNTIGSDLSCDICLRETSVSVQHGILLARKQTDENGNDYIHVMLSDTNSSYGTCVNGERLNFEKVTCADGDIINIGQNYVLVLSLFKRTDMLSVAYGFDRIPDPQKPEEDSPRPVVENIVVEKPLNQVEDHSTNITHEMQEESSIDFYKPTKQQAQDHFNNKTIIL